MKKIKIITENHKAINEEIQKAEGKAKSRQVVGTDIFNAVKWAEKIFADVPKKYWVGTKITNEAYLPNSYKYKGEFTEYTIIRKSTAWYLVDVKRENCKKISYGGYDRNIISMPIETQDYLKSVLFEKAIS